MDNCVQENRFIYNREIGEAVEKSLRVQTLREHINHR